MAKHDLLERLTTMVSERQSFLDIMEDGIVEDREVVEQADRVNGLMQQVEAKLSAEDFELVSEMIAELAVLQVVTHINSLH
ncbi:MAG: hypothetical protein ACRC46_06850 [Thermoguttaceae bacterium]